VFFLPVVFVLIFNVQVVLDVVVSAAIAVVE